MRKNRRDSEQNAIVQRYRTLLINFVNGYQEIEQERQKKEDYIQFDFYLCFVYGMVESARRMLEQLDK